MRSIFVTLLLGLSFSAWSIVFINEIHYDNAGADVNEFVEVAGTAGTDLTGWTIVLYNGNGGVTYGSAINLSGTLPDDGSGGGTSMAFVLPSNGLQNGAPDGMALIDNTATVVEFISYEGSFTANNGPALGLTSVDIGVSETNSTPAGNSLQRTDNGATSPGTWVGPIAETPGATNTGQMLPVELQNFSVE